MHDFTIDFWRAVVKLKIYGAGCCHLGSPASSAYLSVKAEIVLILHDFKP